MADKQLVNIRGEYESSRVSEKEEEPQKDYSPSDYSFRHACSPLFERCDVSPMRKLSSGLFTTPAQTHALEDIREEDNEDECPPAYHNPPPCTNFSILPSHTTPPSRQNKVLNPFDSALIKRLHRPIYSPSVFKNVVSPTQDMHQFCWTIEDVAKIQPASIEYQPQQHEQAIDPETELKAQEAIDHYFCNSHRVSSPWCPQLPNKTSALFIETNEDVITDKEDSFIGSNVSEEDATSTNISAKREEVSTQTELSFPEELPPAVIAVLKPYLTFAEEREPVEEGSLSTSTLRRKLFVHEDHKEMSLSPVRSSCFSMQVECKLSSPAHSGLLLTTSRIICPSSPIIERRTCETPLHGCKILSSPEISPIDGLLSRKNKSVTRLNFGRRLTSLDKSTTRSSSVSPLGLVPIQHDDEGCTVEKTTDCDLSNTSSAMITSITSTPVKNSESSSSTSSMITSEASTPVKTDFPSFVGDVSMESNHFKQIQTKLREYENNDNITLEDELTTLNSFSLHSTAGISQDTGYNTDCNSCNITGINNGISAFSSLSSISRNMASVHFKSIGDKHIRVSTECFSDDKLHPAKTTSVALHDNSLWLPSSHNIISSTPTK